jgi:ArsR family transcriptional regulator
MPIRLCEQLKAAAEPTRLRILNLLRRGSICVCDLQEILHLPQSTVSRHLATLRHAGLVLDQRVDQRVVYSLALAGSAQLQGLRDLLDRCCEAEERLREDLACLKRLLRKGECSLVSMRGRREKIRRGGGA